MYCTQIAIIGFSLSSDFPQEFGDYSLSVNIKTCGSGGDEGTSIIDFRSLWASLTAYL